MHAVGWWWVLQLVAGSAPTGSGCLSSSLERYEPRSFLGHACEDDCQRHKAGFAWAVRHGALNEVACRELPGPEAAGCRIYADYAISPEAAGYRWALENEITDPCLCDGAGDRFRDGCLQQLLPREPRNTY
jgi:hypothetical protein